MSVYVIGDIHGAYDKFMELLDKLNPQPDDMLIQIGDLIDRGPDGVKVVQWFMKHPEVTVLMGNHELLMNELFFNRSDPNHVLEVTRAWYDNGGYSTLNALHELDPNETKDIVEWVKKLPTAVNLDIEFDTGKEHFYITHGWPNDDPIKRIWNRPTRDSVRPMKDTTVVVGHTPTYFLQEYVDDAKEAEKFLNDLQITGEHCEIFHGDGWIDIDCGSGHQVSFPAVRLAAIDLETMEEFYV